MEADERPNKIRKISNDHHGLVPESLSDLSDHQAHVDDAHGHDAPISEGQDAALMRADTDANEDASQLGKAATQPMSKNQMKKLKRKAEWEAGRDDRKLRRREKDKEKKARMRLAKQEAAKERAATNPQDQNPRGQRPKRPQPPKKQHLPIALVLDCGFDHLMTDKEIMSLGSQVTRCYSDNSKATLQAHLYVSGWQPETELRKRFEGLLRGTYRNWRGIKFVEGDWAQSARDARHDMRTSKHDKLVGAFEKYAPVKAGSGNEQAASAHNIVVGDVQVDSQKGAETLAAAAVHAGPVEENQSGLADQGEVIYLTSDSPYTLTELKPHHTYVIGGIVDKNRHKGICYRTATEKNEQLKAQLSDQDESDDPSRVSAVKTAKLPIGEYMAMTSRHVLATNHVVEIMLKWLETSDWGQAFLEVMPKRKGGVLKTDAQNTGDGTSEEEEDGDVAESDVDSAAGLGDDTNGHEQPE